MKTIILFIFLIGSQICSAQSNILWQRVYPGPYDDDDIGLDICQSTDGNFYLAGGVTGFQLFPRFYVIKINPYGQKIWSKEMPGIHGYAFCITPTLDGGCVVCGDAARFVKLSADGDTLADTVPMDGNEKRMYDIQRTTDNFFVACGRYNVNNSIIIKFDSLGKMIWQKIFPPNYTRQLNRIEEAINGGYISVGTKRNTFSDTLRLNILRSDTSGSIIWEKDYSDASGGNVLIKHNNIYVICGQKLVTKTDTSGNRIESFNVNGLNSSEGITDMKILDVNRFVYCTKVTEIVPDVYARILISDATGNLIRAKLFNYSEFIYLTSISKVNENNMIFFGAAYYDTIPKSNFYAIRTDSMFNIVPVGIKNENIVIPNDFNLYQNYPNPFNNSTVIRFDIFQNDYYELEIFNSLGKQVRKLFSEYKNIGNYEIKFNFENLPSGLFFYRLRNSVGSKVNSLVLLK